MSNFFGRNLEDCISFCDYLSFKLVRIFTFYFCLNFCVFGGFRFSLFYYHMRSHFFGVRFCKFLEFLRMCKIFVYCLECSCCLECQLLFLDKEIWSKVERRLWNQLYVKCVLSRLV